MVVVVAVVRVLLLPAVVVVLLLLQLLPELPPMSNAWRSFNVRTAPVPPSPFVWEQPRAEDQPGVANPYERAPPSDDLAGRFVYAQLLHRTRILAPTTLSRPSSTLPHRELALAVARR
jgi:hypothetical protein